MPVNSYRMPGGLRRAGRYTLYPSYVRLAEYAKNSGKERVVQAAFKVNTCKYNRAYCLPLLATNRKIE